MTKQGYLGLLRRNLDPTIGRYRLAEITPFVVRAWYAGVAAGASAGRDKAAKSYRLLRAVLNTAVDDELIARNPLIDSTGGVRSPV